MNTSATKLPTIPPYMSEKTSVFFLITSTPIRRAVYVAIATKRFDAATK